MRINFIGTPPAAPRPAAPAARATPAKAAMSESERRSRQETAALFARWDHMKALAAEFGEPDGNLAIDLAQRAVDPAEARRLFAQRAALRGWASGLSAAQAMH